MARIVRGGLIQASNPVTGEASVKKIKDAMIAKHEKLIAQAAKKGVQVLCMQEIFYGPYFCCEQEIKWYESTERVPDGPTTKLMQKLAKKYGMVLVVPVYEEEAIGTYYNTAAVIDADGKYLGKYRKNHIPHCNPGFWEKFYFKPGNLGYPVFDTAVGKVGVYICYDRHFPEGWRMLGLNGAEIVFNPSATVAGLSEYLWKLEQPAAAVANIYYVGAINRVGTEKPWNFGEFYGQSYFANPRGKIIAEGPREKDAVIVADLDMDLIREVRNVWQFYRDRRLIPTTTWSSSFRDMSEGVTVTNGIHEVTQDISGSPYWNHDLAPTRIADRKWAMKDIAALWISMSACIPTYMLASSLISEGMNWYQAVLTIFLGNAIVLVPMILNAHAGTKYGIPFPVYCRPSFGIRGANIPALLRAFVACGWFGIQTWIGGWAIYKIITIYAPSLEKLQPWFGGINIAEFACFMFFWGINMFVIYKGIESIRVLLDIKAPLLILLGLALLAWAYKQAGGFGEMLNQPSAFVPGGPKAGQFWAVFFPSLTGMIGFWATLSLNIPDFTRYSKTQRDQMIGQAIGLPTTMALYSFIGVAVTSATVVIFGKAIWDPVVLITKFTHPLVLAVSLFALCLATLATNLAANVVSPANDFANLWPSKITFRIGGLITGIIGILIQPWKLVSDPTGYIFTWLVGYSALLGPIGGILICDYFVIRNATLHPVELYKRSGRYFYGNGFNFSAIIALLLGVAPNVPGFLGTIKVLDPKSVGSVLMHVYNYAWFVGFIISFVVYWALMSRKTER